jgi:hypothetical protein
MADSEPTRGAGGPAGEAAQRAVLEAAGALREGAEERPDREGPLEIERRRKDDGRSLILYSRLGPLD